MIFGRQCGVVRSLSLHHKSLFFAPSLPLSLLNHYLRVNPLATLALVCGGVGGGVAGLRWGGVLGKAQGGHYPHLSLLLSTGTGIFLITTDNPHWLRVSLASLWRGRKSWRLLGGKNAGNIWEGCSLLSLHWRHDPPLLTVRAEYITKT